MVKSNTKKGIEWFVKENLVTVNNKRFECIDGRFTPEQSEGAVRAPGGDFGMIMAFAGALKDEGTFLDPDEIIGRYLKAVRRKRGEGAKLYYHTDTHNQKDGGIGCGHIAKASSPEYDGLYGKLTYLEVKRLYESFSQNPNTNLTVLNGHHDEQAVLFVHGQSDKSPISYSVSSMDQSGNMYFVVDIDRAIRFIDKATPFFSEGLLTPVDAEDVKRNFLLQLNATAELLAADLDRYNILIDPKGNSYIERAGHLKQN